MNFSVFTGNIGAVKDVATVGGSKVLNFSVAVNKHYKKGEEKITETVWYECAIWNRENIYPFLKAGTSVTIQGEVGARAYIDKSDPTKAVAVLTCTVDLIEFSNKDKE